MSTDPVATKASIIPVLTFVATVEQRPAGVSVEQVLKNVGVSRTVYQQLKHLRETAQADADPDIRNAATEAIAGIDASSLSVSGGYWQVVQLRESRYGTRKLHREPDTSPARSRTLSARHDYQGLVAFAHVLEGAAMRYDGVTSEKDFTHSVTPERAEEIDQILYRVKTTLFRIQQALRQRANTLENQ